MIELSDEQRQAIDERPGEPLRILDARTSRTFVLLPSEHYERLAGLLEDPRIGMAMMNQIMADDDANDPYLESYQP